MLFVEKRGGKVYNDSCSRHNDLVRISARNVAFGATVCVLVIIWSTAPLTMIGPSLDFVGCFSLGKRSVDGNAVFCDSERSRVIGRGVSFECLEQPNGRRLSVIRTCSLGKDRTGRVPH